MLLEGLFRPLAGEAIANDCLRAMELSPRMETFFGDWALQQQRTIDGLEHEAELASFYTRLERVALKLAMLSELASDAGSRQISQNALMDGINLVGWLQENLRRLFESEFTWSKDMEDKQKLLRIIERKPGIERRELLRLSHQKVTVFDPLLNTLLQEGSAHKSKAGYYPGASAFTLELSRSRASTDCAA